MVDSQFTATPLIPMPTFHLTQIGSSLARLLAEPEVATLILFALPFVLVVAAGLLALRARGSQRRRPTLAYSRPRQASFAQGLSVNLADRGVQRSIAQASGQDVA